MRLISATTLLLLTAGCASVSESESAVCDGTLGARDAHTVALVADGGPRSKITGARLLGLLDAGCDDI